MELTRNEFVRGERTFTASRRHGRIIYVLQGDATLITKSESIGLSTTTGALAIVNAGREATLNVAAESLAVVCTFDASGLRRMLNDHPLYFVCDPSLRHQAAYADLARSMDALLAAEAETGDFASLHREVAEMSLLSHIIDGFGGATPPALSRAERFREYVDTHYNEPLSLAQAAQFFDLTPEHFSKVFKREVGQAFHAYITETRLDVATEQLCSSDDTVTRIALEAGFPNVGSFNQAFKTRYGTTPVHYKKEHARQKVPATIEPMANEFVQHGDGSESSRRKEDLITIDVLAHHESLRASWRNLIGLGTVHSLGYARVREQALWLKQHLEFDRWRVGCDFLAYDNERGRYDIIDCFDFLVGNGFVPHVLAEYTPSYNADDYAQAFVSAIRQCANRYSVQTVRTWSFELPLHGWAAGTPFDKHFELFQRIKKALEPYGLDRDLRGPGILPDQRCGNLRLYLSEARRRGIRPGAITISCRPMAPAGNKDESLVRTADRYYLRNQVLMARETLAAEGFDPDLLMVGGWRNSLEHSNVMNDSCYHGANIMQTVLSSWNLIGSLCYNDALDLSTPGATTSLFLSGRPGIVSRDGIPKPAFYALDFLAHVNERLVLSNERCLASANQMGNYQIVCHNCERLNAKYLATPESKLDWRQLDSYHDQPGERLIRFCMQNVRPGTYLIKARYVNAEGGSVGNEAQRMRLWCMDEPSRSEIEILKAASVPKMLLERVLVLDDGILEFERQLKSNEIAYFHVIYLY